MEKTKTNSAQRTESSNTEEYSKQQRLLSFNELCDNIEQTAYAFIGCVFADREDYPAILKGFCERFDNVKGYMREQMHQGTGAPLPPTNAFGSEEQQNTQVSQQWGLSEQTAALLSLYDEFLTFRDKAVRVIASLHPAGDEEEIKVSVYKEAWALLQVIKSEVMNKVELNFYDNTTNKKL